MPIDPEARQRLDNLMNARRIELDLTWRDLAVLAKMSPEALRNIRNGEGGMRDLYARRLSLALGWEPGEVASLLAGKAPQDAPEIARLNWHLPRVREIWDSPGIPGPARAGLIGQLPGIRVPGEAGDGDEGAG